MIIKPVLTEKSARGVSDGVYVFSVSAQTSKGSIQDEIEKQFNVRIIKIRTVMIPEKKRRLKHASRFKKAYVHLAKGQKIPMIEEVINAK